jgi:serine phosphatase RsbU (regulator of sigma subunit)
VTIAQDLRHDPAWRAVAASLLLTAGAALLSLRLPASGPLPAVAAVTWAAAWLLAVRFRLAAARRPRRVLVVAVLAAAGTLSGGEGLRIAGLVLGVLFMLQRPAALRLLRSRQRVAIFLAAGPLLALSVGGGFARPDGPAGAVVVFCRSGLQAFWLATLLGLLIGMRLHFLRLRPKLLVAGVLVGVVPLVLLAVFGLVLLYGALGGSRANRARDVLLDWSRTHAEGRAPDLLSAPPLLWDEARPDRGPPWGADLLAALRRYRDDVAAGRRPLTLDRGAGGGRTTAGDGAIRVDLGDEDDDRTWNLGPVAASTDTAAWVHAEGAYWLVRWQDPGPGRARLQALALDPPALARLARLVRADLQVRDLRGGTMTVAGTDSAAAFLESRDPVGRSDPDGDLWRRPRFFGTTMLPAIELSEQRVGRGFIWLTLQTSLRGLVGEFASREAAFNVALLVALGVVALLFLGTSLVAFIFSLRITGGITGAVAALHRGTQRLAAGDLDAVIEIENEDEFGDLARSFNAMTVAVKQGREDALARERLQQEMATARQIQERLLPRDAPELAGWQITGLSLPSQQVGGDYFDFLQPAPGRLGVAIGDVSGKGVPAALLMSNLQASLKGQVLDQAPVGEVVARINRLLTTSTDPHMFATFVYGELDVADGSFVCANAGHEPPLVVRADGAVEWLTEGGLLLGMLPDQRYEPATVVLAPGDVLVLYTDGITEAGAPNPAQARPGDDDSDDHLFGEERLAEVVREARGRTALGIREAILGAVQRHLAGRPAGDDITLVVVRRG